MNQTVFIITASILGLMNLSMYRDGSYDHLTDQDYEMERLYNESGPALNSPSDIEPYWESYNEWICFSTSELQLSCTEHYLEETVRVPTLSVKKDGRAYEIEVSVAQKLQCEVTLDEWMILLENEDNFCVLAAYLQELEYSGEPSANQSLWIIKALKTRAGYWIEPST